MGLTLQLFGSPRLMHGGAQVDFPRRKALALLSYLAVTRMRHQRDVLQTLLWPEASEDAASQAFRNVLWTIRQTPVRELLKADRSRIELVHDEALIVDVNEFRRLIGHCPSETHGRMSACSECAPLLRRAIQLRDGPFMSGFSIRRSVSFDDWLVAENEALRRELDETFDRLTMHFLRTRNWVDADTYAAMWVAVDPLNEIGQLRRMQALAALGKRQDALRVFVACKAALSTELGMSPGNETQKLAERIRAGMQLRESAGMVPSRLPRIAQQVIGRQDIANRIESLLVESGTRVVSLVGLGGNGKSALALHVGHRLERRFAGGAICVALDDGQSNIPVSMLVGSALGLAVADTLEGDQDRALALAISHRELLLILDGAEERVSEVASLVEELRYAPGVRVLITSRIDVGVRGETRIPLNGLSYPDRDVPLDQMAHSPAIRLLRRSAERYGFGTGETSDEIHDMARLCRLLQGSPLGLEMAAGWRSLMDWRAIADRIEQDLHFLVPRIPSMSRRHDAFSSVFKQSWALLNARQQWTLRRLSIFRGRFTIRAAEAISDSDAATLAVLLNRGLIVRLGSELFELHELVRQFARLQLEQDPGAVERVRRRFVGYYASTMSQWMNALKRDEQHRALMCVQQEIVNLKTAFQSAAEMGDTEELRELCDGLFYYYDIRTLLNEAEPVFAAASRAYSLHPRRDTILDAYLRIAAGTFILWDRPQLGFQRQAEGATLLADSKPECRLHAHALVILAHMSFGKHRNLNKARIEAALRFYRERSDRWGEAIALSAEAVLERYHDIDVAQKRACESLLIHREEGNRWGEARLLHTLARLDELCGDLELALTRYEKSLSILKTLGRDSFDVLTSLIGQARVNGRLGRENRRMSLAAEAADRSREVGYSFQAGRALLELGRGAQAMGELARAKQYAEQAFALLSQRPWSDLQGECATLLAELAIEESDVGAAEGWIRDAKMLGSSFDRLTELNLELDTLRQGRAPDVPRVR